MSQIQITVPDKSSGDLRYATEDNAVKSVVNSNATDAESRFSLLELDKRIIVNQANAVTILGGTIDATKEYLIDGILDLGSTQITVPAGGMSIRGYSFDICGLTSSANNYTMFISESTGGDGLGSGNLMGADYLVSVTGTGSKVYNLYSEDGNGAIELSKVNYNNCTSLGDFHSYRQILEVGTGRFGGRPSLTFNGTMSGGCRISTSIVRGLSSSMTEALFREGVSLTMGGRFKTDINVDLPALAPLCDFTESVFINDESFILGGTYITRDGILNSSDTNIIPNMTQKSVKCLWSDNTGIANTTKYLKGNIAGATTTISSQGVYYDMLGTYAIEDSSHIAMPSNGIFEILSGSGAYRIVGDFTLDSSSNDVLDIRIVKSTDGGSTYPISIQHISRVVNNLSGGRDVAFFSINFLTNFNEGDKIKVQVENVSGTSNITVETGGYLVISDI